MLLPDKWWNIFGPRAQRLTFAPSLDLQWISRSSFIFPRALSRLCGKDLNTISRHTVPLLLPLTGQQQSSLDISKTLFVPGPISLQGIVLPKWRAGRYTRTWPTTPLMRSIDKASGIKSLHWVSDSRGEKQICATLLSPVKELAFGGAAYSQDNSAVYGQSGTSYKVAIFQQDLEKRYHSAQEATYWSVQLWQARTGLLPAAPAYCLDLRYELGLVPPQTYPSQLHFSPQKRSVSDRLSAHHVFRL